MSLVPAGRRSIIMLEPLIAHGGVAGAAVELSLALLIVAIALAVWVGGRKDKP
jgi:hypothetical protein